MQQQLVTAGVQIAEGGEGQDQVVLLCGLSPDGEGGAVAGPLAAGDVAGLQLREDGAQLLHGLGGEAAGEGGDQIAGAVVGLLIGPKALPCHLVQGGGFPQDGAGQRGTLVDRGGQPLRGQVLRGILIHPDLLQNDPALQLYVPLSKTGVEQHVAEQVDGPVQVAVQTPGIVTGELLSGIGVDLPADGVGLPGQSASVPPLGPLEGHVLNKVGRAALRGALVAGAGAHKEPQGRGAGSGDEFGQ